MTKSVTLPTGWKAPSSGGTGGAVTSVDGRTGVVVLSDIYTNKTGDTMTGLLTVPTLNVGATSAGGVNVKAVGVGMVANGAGNITGALRGLEVGVGNTGTGTTTTATGLEIDPPAGTGLISTANGLIVRGQGRTGVNVAVGLAVDPVVGANVNFGVIVGTATTRTFWLASDTQPTTPAGGIFFGSSADTNLYRSGPDTLRTDDKVFASYAATDTITTEYATRGLKTTTYSADSAFADTSAGGSFDHTVAGVGNKTGANFAGLAGSIVNTGAGSVNGMNGVNIVAANNGAGTVANVNLISVTQLPPTGPVSSLVGLRIAGLGHANIANSIGIDVAPSSASGVSGVGIRVGTAKSAALWLAYDSDPTAASNGIFFGLSADTNLYRSAAGTLRTDGVMRLGTNAAGAGILGIPNNAQISARNAANTTNLNLMIMNSSNVVQVGENTVPVLAPGGLALGTNPAQSGVIRLPNNGAVTARNSINTIDTDILLMDGSNNTILRGITATGVRIVSGASTTLLTVGTPNIVVGETINLSFGTVTGTKIGINTTGKFAFWGATPVAQQTGLPAAATDDATTQTLANYLRTLMLTLGLAAT